MKPVIQEDGSPLRRGHPVSPEASAEPSAGSRSDLDASAAPNRSTGLAGLARGSTANLAGAAVAAVANFGLTVAITRGLTKESAGVFFASTSLFLLLTTIGALGTTTGLVYFISRCRALGRLDLVPAYMRTALRPVTVVACAMGAMLFVLAPEVAQVVSSQHIAETTRYLRILAVFIPFIGVENVALSGLRGLGSMRANVLVEQLCRPLLQTVLVLTVIAAHSRGLLGLSWAFPYLPAAVVSYVWWRRHTPDGPRLGHQAGAEKVTRRFWRFTAPRAFASVGQLALQRLDIVLVAALAGAAAAAVYASATRFIVVGQMGNRAISLAVQPRLAAALAREDLDSARELYQISTAWLTAITWPFYLLLALFSSTLLQVFGKGYSSGGPALILLASCMVVAMGCGMVDMVLTMGGRTSWNLANVALALGVNLGLDLWLIPGHGFMGAALGWGAAILLSNLVPLAQVALVLKLHPFGRASLAVGAANILCFLAIPALCRVILGASWTSLGTALVLGSGAYLGVIWALRGTLQLAAWRQILRRPPTATAPAA